MSLVDRNPFESTTPSIDAVPEGLTHEMEYDPEDGSVTVEFGPEGGEASEDPFSSDKEFYSNLATDMDEEVLREIGMQVVDSYESDKESRAEWEGMFERGFDLLGLKLEETSEPFEGATTAVHPLIIEAAVTFQSKASAELLPAGGPVKTQILGEQTPEKMDQANRVRNVLNYQLTTEMPEYFDETERMLFHLPIIGSAFKKTYYDGNLQRPVSEFVPLEQFFVSNFASNLAKADRYTQVIYRSEIDMDRDIVNGLYMDIDLQEPSLPESNPLGDKMNVIMGVTPSSEFDPQYVILEQHTYLEIESDKDDSSYAYLPYIVSVIEGTHQVLSIRRNYDDKDSMRKAKQFFTHYKYVPGFGFYGLGLIHFLGNLTMSATAAMRSLLDAGQFATLPAGFKAKGVRVVGDNDPISPGEFREVEATGVDLTKAIVPLPYKEPSPTLFSMLQFVTETGQKFADNTEQVINDSANYGPVGTTMVLLEASGKFFSAIHKRLHKSQKEELQILARVNYESGPAIYPYDLPNESGKAYKKDFDGRVDIIPVTDPNIPSNAHRMMMAQMALDVAYKSPPGMFNMEELNRTVLQAANLPNLERIMPKKPEPQPVDPVTDIVAAAKGIPIKAFAGQDHDAHIQVKMAYMQDPINGANPIMQRLQPILNANIQEHSVMKYQEQMMGTTKAMVGPNSSPQAMEMAQAQAAQQVAQANAQAAQGSASPEQQMVAMEGQRLQLEDKKIDAQMAKENANVLLKDRDLDLKEMKLRIDATGKGTEIMSNIEEKEKDREHEKLMEAVKIITDLISQEEASDTTKRIKAADIIGKVMVEQNKASKKGE